jgi:hypothetical protein
MTPTAPQATQGDLDLTGQSKGGLSRLDREFLEFNDANPHVYRALVTLARQWVNRNLERAQRTGNQRAMFRLGMKALWERMRWDVAMETDDPAGFKANNNFVSRYGRKIMEQEPDLRGVFEIRELRS